MWFLSTRNPKFLLLANNNFAGPQQYKGMDRPLALWASLRPWFRTSMKPRWSQCGGLFLPYSRGTTSCEPATDAPSISPSTRLQPLRNR